MTRWRTHRRGSRHDRGAAAVEFAIVLVVLLLIIFAIIDFGRLLFAVQAAKSASREGVRVAAVRTEWNSGPATDVLPTTTGAASAGAALAGGGAIIVTASQNGGTPFVPATPGFQLCTAASPSVEIAVSFPFTWFTPASFFAQSVNQVEATTTMRCE